MSLLVWLPLSGNFNNNGVAYVDPFTMPSGGSWSAGRVGNNLTIANGGIGKTCSKLNGLTTFSISLWYRTTASKTFTQWSDIVSISSSSQFRLETCNTGGSATNWFGLGLNSGGTTTQNITPGTWYHDVLTVNGATFKRYINGNLIGTVTAGSTVALTNTLTLGNGGMYCQMADLRIYDNILSDKEIKEIYKYKVLHWPLDNRGAGGNNLCTNTNTASIDTNAFGYSEQTGGSTRTIEYDGGTPCVKVTRNTTAHSGWAYMWYTGFQRNNVKTNTTYTVSFDVIASGSGTIGLSGFMNGNGTNNMSASTTAIQNSFNANNWSHLVFRTTTLSSFSSITVGSQVVYMSCGFMNSTSVWIKMKNMKVEEGSTDTPWIPNSSDAAYTSMGLNDTKEYDTSGYLRHGTIVSALPTIDSDTPKYSCSYKYAGSVNNTHYNNTTDLNFTDNFSWAIWVKTNYTGTTAQYIFTVGRADAGGYGYGLQCASASQCNIKYGNASWALAVTGGTWTHIAFTKSGNTCKIYKNGALASTQTFSGTAPTFSDGNGVGIGCFHYSSNIYPYYGNASDFRIYANTLTDNDIKDIYNGISIDNVGNVYAFDFSEK